MALTNPKDFKELINILPKDVLKNTWFFPLKQDRKNPDVPPGTILKGNLAYRLSYYDAINRLKWGKNVGIYALTGGLMFLDLDVKNSNFIASYELIYKILDIPTISVKTRNGGLQKYFLNEGKYPSQLIKENGVIVGELRTNWQYVVSVGSYVTPDEHSNHGDGTYRLNAKKCYMQLLSFENIPGLDPLAKIGETQKIEKTTWNNNTVTAETISIEDHDIIMKNKVRRRI